jgi:hypothetical protein
MKITKQTTLGYHANEDELNEKEGSKGFLISRGLNYGEQH